MLLKKRERLLSGGTREDETVASYVHECLFGLRLYVVRTMHCQVLLGLFCLYLKGGYYNNPVSLKHIVHDISQNIA